MEDFTEEEPQMELLPEQRAPELLQACKENNTALALELISLGVPVTGHVLEKGWTGLHFAALNGNEELVLALLRAGSADRYKHMKARGSGKEHPCMCNTPLQWACFHGHVNVCWFLLESGYDPDDADTLGNTCLHLAASNHHSEVVRVLLKSGADATVQNIFAHTAFDVATDPACRELLRKAMPVTLLQSATTHSSLGRGNSTTNVLAAINNKESLNQQNILAFKSAQDQLEHAMLLPGTEENIRMLENYVAQGKGTVRTELLDKASALVRQWRASLALQAQIDKVSKASPILTQRQYCELVNRLEALVQQAKAAGVEGPVLEQAHELVERSFAEYWLKKSAAPLEDVECACSKHTKDMASLEEHLKKARAAQANLDLVTKYEVLLSRLTCEVGLRNALDGFPEVRLPAPEMAKDYWQPEDIGHVQETEGFPLPPEDGYKWIHSDSYNRHKKAAAALKAAIEEAEKYGGHPPTVAEARLKDKQADGVSKVLEAKDEADRAVAITAAEKLAKKLKKGKKK